MIKYNFVTFEEFASKFLVCPKCRELLSPTDLDTYLVCPYCSKILERNADLDDFVVEPMVQGWISNYSQARPDGRSNR